MGQLSSVSNSWPILLGERAIRKMKRKTLCIGLLVASLGLCLTQLWLASPAKHRAPMATVMTEEFHDVTGSDTVVARNPSELWVVVDAADELCDVKHYVRLQHWKTVVVRSRKVKNCSPPSCTQLDHQVELGLGHHLDRVLLRSSPARRMIAYLYCISQGAKIIYDGACALKPRHSLRHILLEGSTDGLVYAGPSPFDPYRHFGIPRAPTPGYPKVRGSVGGSRDLYSLRTMPVPTVQQGLPLGCEDVQGQSRKTGPLQEQDFAPAFTENSTLGPLGPSNIAYTFEAFWTLVLPFVELTPKVQFLRSYIIQTLVHTWGGQIGYFSTTADCEWMTGNKTRYKWSEKEIKSWHKFFKSWRCRKDFSSFACLQHLIKGLVKSGHLEQVSINITRAWIHDLKNIGYIAPLSPVESSPQIDKEIPVLYTSPGRLHYEILNKTSSLHKAVERELVGRLKEVCQKANYQVTSFRNPVFEDIFLIVILNYQTLHKNIPFLELIHRRVYRHILYCGPDVEDFQALRDTTGLDYVSYVQGINGTWYQMYDCARHAMRLNANVQGYLFIGDDTLVNFWSIWHLPRDRLWLPGGMSGVSREAVSHPWKWFWWTRRQGRQAVNDAFKELELRAPDDDVVSAFLTTFYKHTRGAKTVYHRALDIFYIPQRLRNEFIVISEIFSRNQVLHELAIPTIHFGLDRESNFVHLEGSSLWRNDRDNAVTFFNKTHAFLHPFKTKQHLGTPEGVKFFCQKYMPMVEENYKRYLRSK